MKNSVKALLLFCVVILLLKVFAPLPGMAQTITSVSRVASPGLPNAGLIVNGGFETGAPPVNTWYQWAKNNTCPAATYTPSGWTATSANNNNGPKRYATWGRLVVGGGIYPFTNNTQQWVYEVYTSTNPSRCFTDLTNATASDPGSFPLGASSVDGNNYLYFGNGSGNITGFPSPQASWLTSTTSPDNLRVYPDNSSLSLSGPAPVRLSQTVATVAGSAYVLEFWVSGEESSPGAQKDGLFQLEIGTQRLYLTVPGSANDHGLGSHFYYRIQFTAAGASTLLRFVNYCHINDASWSSYLAGTTAAELLLDDVRVNLATVLPVQLVSFTANPNGNNVHLYWKTAAEVNFSHFEIERSFTADGTFMPIGNRVSQHTGSGEYRYTDDLPNDLQKESAFYRLKMVDKDGYAEYSSTAAIKLRKKIPILIFPSLVKKGMPITVQKEVSSLNTAVQLADLNGRVLQNKLFNGTNTVKIETTGLAAGVYIVAIIGSQAKDTYKVMIE